MYVFMDLVVSVAVLLYEHALGKFALHRPGSHV